MIEVARATVTIIPNMQGAQKKITEDLTDATTPAGESAGGNLGKKILKGLAAAFTAIEVGKLISKTLDAGAALQQSIGGVETLFGTSGQSLEEFAEATGRTVEEAAADYDKLMESQTAVIENANRAYATAGLSANSYMEQATSFAARLLQGLEGDTQAAAEYTDLAITDMADNANKFGTDVGSIQNAYQGFAKANYTMLDNLKLGYGGTKAEMERLLADAGELAIQQGLVSESAMRVFVDEEKVEKAMEAVASAEDKATKKQMALEKARISYNEALSKYGEGSAKEETAAINLSEAYMELESATDDLAQARAELEQAQQGTESVFDISNFADIIQAIHIIQMELGVTGTTEAEAAATFSGSMASMKAATENLMADISLGNDTEASMAAMEETIKTFLVNNAAPMVANVLKSLPSIIAETPGFLADLAEGMGPTAAEMITGLITGLLDPDNVEKFINGAFDLVENIGKALELVDWGQIANNAIDSLIAALKTSAYRVKEWLTSPAIFIEDPNQRNVASQSIMSPEQYAADMRASGMYTEAEIADIMAGWDDDDFPPYAAAATEGAIFSQPQRILVGDAAQPEMLIGQDTLYSMISRASADGGAGQTAALGRILSVLDQIVSGGLSLDTSKDHLVLEVQRGLRDLERAGV